MKSIRRLAVAAFVLFWAMIFSATASADDPSLDYHTIRTPHFWVHYHDGGADLARKVAIACEEAHTILTPLLDWTPRGRTHVIVDDKVDSANGFATSYGRRQITVFGMPPESDSVLGFYDDWIRVLVFHEYVHILHLDTVLGIPPLVNKVIGRQWIPNQTLPRWYIEGLATYYESSTTRGGRVDASLFKMYLRVAALNGEFFDLGTVSGAPYDWPGGTAAYLYGGFFLDYVFNKHGAKLGSDFNRTYGRRMIPWAMNAISDDLSGDTFDEMYNEWTAAEYGRAHATRIAVQAAGETPLERVTTKGGGTGWPNLRPHTTELWFYDFDHETAPHYTSILSTGTGRTKEFEVEAGAGPFAFTPDGEQVVYSQRIEFKSAYRFADLYMYDLDNGTRHRLTRGERAREPAVSPDGKQLAYVRNRGGTMELVVRRYPGIGAPERVLVSGLEHDRDDPARWQQIATPRWSPDGTRLVFSWWRQDDGQRDLWTIDVADGTLQRLTDDFAVDVDPFWAPDGTIYFSTDRTGVYNVHAVRAEPEPRVEQVSNVTTGVFAPQLAADGRTMFVSAYGPEGFDLAKFRLPDEFEPASPSVLDAIEPVEYPEVDTSTFEERDYSPLPWMQPLLLQPQIGVLTSGAGAGGALVGYDPIGRHSYELTAGYTTGRELQQRGAVASLAYGYRRLPVSLSLSAALQDYARTRSLFVESDYKPFIERQYLGRITAQYPFRALTDSLTFSMAYEVDYTTYQNVPPINHDPADLEPLEPEQGWFNELDFSLRYSSRESYPQSITTSNGWAANVSLDVQDPAIGSTYQRLTFGYGLDLFVQNPVFPRHVLGLFFDGAISTSDTSSPRNYSLGGNRPQDIFTSVVLQQQRGSFVVRGFPTGVTDGPQYHRGVLEYRFPILELDQGFSTVPIFFRQLKGAAFVDTGAAFRGYLGDAELLTGIGGEVVLQSVFAYYLFGNLRLGYAHGLGEQGISEFYALFGGGF